MLKKSLSIFLILALFLGCGPVSQPDEGVNPPAEEETPSTPEKPEEPEDPEQPETPEEPETPSTPKEEVEENENFTKEGSRGNVTLWNDGSATLKAGGNDTYSPRIKLKSGVRSFDVTIRIKNNNLYAFNGGHFILEGKGPDGISYQFRLGSGVTNNFSTAGAYTPDVTYAEMTPTYNMNGLDVSFDASNTEIPAAIDGNMTLRFKIGPYVPDNGDPVRIFAQAWLDDKQILNLRDARECPWFEGSGYEGCELHFGVNNAQGEFTIEDVEWIEQQEAAQPAAAEKHVFIDRFEQSATATAPEKDYWEYVKAGSAAWQVTCTGDPKLSFVNSDGNLELVVQKRNGQVESGAIKTEYLRSFRNCHIEVRAKWDGNKGRSIGRAIWLMPQWPYNVYKGWPHGGEIDVMEHNYCTEYIRQTIHTYYIHNIADYTEIYDGVPNPTAGRVTYVGFPEGYKECEWNTYGVDITDEYLAYYINGRQTHKYVNKHLPDEAEVMQWPFATQYYLILSIGNAAKSPASDADCPANMLIDYVKVTKK